MSMPATPEDCPLWGPPIPFTEACARLYVRPIEMYTMIEYGMMERCAWGASDSPHSVVYVRIIDANAVRQYQSECWARQTVELLAPSEGEE